MRDVLALLKAYWLEDDQTALSAIADAYEEVGDSEMARHIREKGFPLFVVRGTERTVAEMVGEKGIPADRVEEFRFVGAAERVAFDSGIDVHVGWDEVFSTTSREEAVLFIQRAVDNYDLDQKDECAHPNAIMLNTGGPLAFHCPDCGEEFVDEAEQDA